MQNIIVLMICFIVGYLLRLSNRISNQAHVTINQFILHISLPCQIILFLNGLKISNELLLPAGMAWIVFLIVYISLLGLKKYFNLSKQAFGCLLLTAGLGNTSFLGLPMIETFFGKEHIAIGILCDQPGTFLILSIVAIPIALKETSNHTEPFQLWKRIFFFPPFISFFVAVMFSGIEIPFILKSGLQRLGDTLAPLALFSVGIQFRNSKLGGIQKELYLGLFLKMILAPLFISGIYFYIFQNTSIVARVSIFEAAMPPMITGGIVAMENNLEPELASMMVAVGILLSSITLPLWKLFLS